MAPSAPGAVANIGPSQFDAAVMNLVVNARDATPSTGRIRVESQTCTLTAGEAEGAEPGEYVCVSVHDTGEGMDPDVAARVFEPFFTTKEQGRGTGLGLSVSYGIVQKHEGEIDFVSREGGGTRFTVYIPILNQAPEH